MSSLLSDLGESAASLPAEAVAFALGLAAGRALEAPATELGQVAWAALPIKVVEPGDAASIVAEDVDSLPWGENEAAQSGIDQDRFQRLVQDVLNAPGTGELLTMIRRQSITTDDLTHGFRKLKLETRWDTALADLQTQRLDPADVARAMQRGLINDAGLLPVAAPTGEGNVPAFPTSQLDGVAEARDMGVTRDRLAVQVGLVGLPPAPGELLSLLNRGIITETDFYRGLAEGNTRNEWGPVLKQLQRRLLTPHEYEEAALRGIITNQQADAGAALSGMTAADAQTLFALMGRPLATHQITTGLARGGNYPSSYDDVPEPYRDAIRRSNIRPEYASLDYANRYTIPSYFVLKQILADGGITEADLATLFKQSAYPPDLADKAAAALAGTGVGAADPHIAKAQTQLWTTTHTAYVSHRITDDEATAALKVAGVADAAVPDVLAVWQAERDLTSSGLSPAQIKKALGLGGSETVAALVKAGYPPDVAAEAAGKTVEWAIGRLQQLGWSTQDAATLLAE